MKRSAVTVVLVLLSLFPLLTGSVAKACTLFAAAGDDWVKGGGTLIVKNRDWQPNHRQELRLTQPKSGFRYLGLHAVSGSEPGLKAGINEKGFVILTASVGSIPKDEMSKIKKSPGITTRLLAGCDSVAAALAKTDLFVGPYFALVADRNCVGYIESGPDGKFAVKSVSNGAVAHTNHYIADKMVGLNKAIGASSKIRFERITKLLGETAHPFDLKAFVGFSQDRVAGPDNSIFRTGSSEKVSHTIAIWTIASPAAGSPRLHLRILNPGEPEQLIEVGLDDVFAGRAKDVISATQKAAKSNN